jgi:VCBS repeat-containing protein
MATRPTVKKVGARHSTPWSRRFRGEYRRGNRLSPILERLEQRLPLTLSYSTYLGGNKDDFASDIAVDSDGNSYVIGTTQSAQIGGIQSPDSGTNRAFLTKYKPDGQIEYTKILGPTPKYDASGYAESIGWQVVVGADNLPIVSFESFETTTLELQAGGLLPLPGRPHLLHVEKLGDTGQSIWSANVPVIDIAGHFDPYAFTDVQMVTRVDSLYVAYTAFRPASGGGVFNDTFITKLSSSGEQHDIKFLDNPVSALALDGDENLYVALTAVDGRGLTDIFIQMYDPNLDLIGTGNLSGSHHDRALGLAADQIKPGHVYVVGLTSSVDFPLLNPFQSLPEPSDSRFSDNAFITLLDLNREEANQLVSSTYFGGSRLDGLSDVALDIAGNVYVVGYTNSPDLPTARPLQAYAEATFIDSFRGPIHARDLVVAKFNDGLTRLEFSTYFGGRGSDSSASIAVDAGGSIYVAASSMGRSLNTENNFVATADFPVKNAAQPEYGGSNERLAPSADAVVFAIAQRGAIVGRGAQVTAGREFTHVVAEFSTPRNASSGDFDVDINWGDGTTTSGFVTRSNANDFQFFVHGTHQYDKPGAYPVRVTVDGLNGQPSPLRVVNVSQSSKSQIPGAIAVDPTDPTRLFAAMTDYKFDSGIRVATSDDAGVTWSPRLVGGVDDKVLPPARGNPDVLFDDFGNLFLAYSGNEDNIVVAWSTDSGRTFKIENRVNFKFTGADGSAPGSPRLAFGAARNEVWVTYETSSVRAAGATVRGLGEVGGFDELTVTGSVGGKHSDIEVGPDGAVAVVWQAVAQGGNVQLLASVDVDGFGDSIFSLPSTVDTSTTDGILHTPAQEGAVPPGPRLAWDTSDGPHRGRLYATFVDLVEGLPNPPGNPELTLFVTSSDDHGLTWSTPTRVTFGPDFQSMFQPSIAVDPTTGVLAVGWHATAGSEPTELSAFTGFFVATSIDGQTFSSAQRVNIDASNVIAPEQTKLDVASYSPPAMAFSNGRLYPFWSDNSALEGSNYSNPQFESVTRIVGVIDVKAAPPAIRPIPIDVIRGQSFTKPVATFTDSSQSATASNFTAQISWGDQVGAGSSQGMISQPGGPGTPFVITGTHTYLETGAYPTAVTVTDVRTGAATKSVSNVSAQQGSQGQPTIAVDPTNPNRLFAAWSDRAGLSRGIPVATSDDGGVTWNKRTIANGNDGLFLPSQAGHAVFDEFGNLFLTYVTHAPIFNTIVLSSKDGGKLFTLLRRFESPMSVEPSIAVGPGENGQGGSVWVSWSHGPAENLSVVVAGAQVDGLDRFQSFQEHVIAPVASDGLFRIYGDIAVGPRGQVLVTYSKGVAGGTPVGPAELVVQLDPDGLGSQPFGAPVKATNTNVGPGTPIPPQAISAIDAEGSLAWDRSDGVHRGRVYLIYTDAATVGDPNTEILLRYSDDNGVTWSLPTAIDNTTKTSFLPSIAVDQSSGNLAMAWFDSDGDAGEHSTSTSFIVTLSDDGGQSHRVRYVVGPGSSDATSSSIADDGSRFQYGRFTGLAFAGGVFQPIWADNSLELQGVPDLRNFEIANARIAVAQVSREPLAVEMVQLNEREGKPFTRQIAKFKDPGGSGSASDYKARIDWGDGSPSSDGEILEEIDGGFSVLGAHDYKKFGHFPITVTIKGNRTKGAGELTAVIENAKVFLNFGTGNEEAQTRVVREMKFTKVVATLMDENPHSKISDFDITIDWGDGSFSDGVLAFTHDGGPGESNSFSISGTHKYRDEQNFTVQVLARERAAETRTDRSGTVISGDPPLVVKPGDFLDIEALEGINTGDLLLVKFTVPDDIHVALQSTVGSYSAAINWGDGEVDIDIVPFVTSEDVTVVGRHTYATAGEFYPYITLKDDSGGFFHVPLIAIVEPDVTDQISAPLPALTYNPLSDRFVGELVITNKSSADISGPLFVVIHGLPEGVSLDSFKAVDGMGNPLHKVNQSRLPAGTSLPPIAVEFRNPNRVPISYTVQVFDGLRPQPLSGAGVVFEPNRGQANAAAAFIARGQGYSIGLSAGQVSLVLSGNDTQAGTAALVELVGANTSPVGVAMDPLPGVSNYFIGQSVINGVPHFGRVRYSQVYLGVDIEYYGREGLLEYDWIVRPQADAGAIAIRFRGANDMSLDSAGNLRLQVNGGELVQRAPVAYQTIGGNHISVAAEYDLRADGSVGITLGNYDHSQVLVIDPVLVYSTYLGGSGFESASAIAVDTVGNSYVVGTTGSSDFFTVNPFDPELNQPDTSPFRLSADAFVTKFDASGAIVYSTYLGGGSSGIDPTIRETQARSISIDNAGQVWVAGVTQSLLFPQTTTAPIGYEANLSNGGSFLTKISEDGSSLLYSSVNSLSVIDIAVDDAGDLYAAGIGFSLKLDPVTNTFRYVTLLGNATASGIAVDSFGQAYVTGFTDSQDFPIKNALFPIHNSISSTGFVAKLTFAGDKMFSTYLNGTAGAADIAVDDSGTIYIVGQTSTNDLPVPNGLDHSIGGTLDGFLFKMANDGQSLLYGTYVGGSGEDRLTGVAVDSRGRTYLSGFSNSVNLPTVRAHQPTPGGSLFLNDFPDDGFAASMAADGKSFEYLTYWGGHGFDRLLGVAADSKGNASFAGNTNSPDLLISNAAQPRLVGNHAFVFRLLAGDSGTLTMHNAPFTVVEGETYNGLVAFFSSNGTETADQFSAIIDWGDGQTSPGTIAGNYREGFQILGNHLYQDVGTHHVFVTLQDSLGRSVTVTTSGVVAAAEGRVRYHVVVDTAALSGVQGQLSFQFNAFPGSAETEARITGLHIFGGVSGASTIEGSVSQFSSSQFTVRPFAVLNQLVQSVTLGSRIEFDLEIAGPGLSEFASSIFALQLLNTGGRVPLLAADASASLLRVHLLPDGRTIARSSSAAVLASASGTATVVNGPVSLSLTPFTVQEGLEYNGPVGNFTDGNPSEVASEFTAEIDWGDGSPVTSGVVTGGAGNFVVSGTHVYQTAGAYTLIVTVVDPDGQAVTRRTGRSILAAETIKNNWRASTVTPVSGDFNGDGILDLAIGPYLALPTGTGEGVGIFLGRGDGSFAQSDLKATGTNINQLATGDFNNDGRLDVAVAITRFGESTVELLFGNGDGTLQSPIQLSDLRNPSTLQAADFNRDGNLDLVYIQSDTPSQNTRSSMLRVAIGRGDGTFLAPKLTTIPFGFHRADVADFNRDAIPDLLLASRDFTGTTRLSLYSGFGDGSFTAAITIASGLAFTSSILINDLDDDGLLDVAASVGSNLLIYNGNSDGTFDTASQIPAPGGAIAAGDFNRDGLVDLAMAESGSGTNLGRLIVFLNNGSGSYSITHHEGVANPATLMAADFDRDGNLDLATSGTIAAISVLAGLGDGRFSSSERYETGLVQVDPNAFRETPEGVIISDLNGDSHNDALLLFRDGPTATQLGSSDGTFQSVVSSGPFAALNSGNIGLGSGRFRNPVLADFNNDGRLDLVGTSLQKGIGIVFGKGDGTFPTSHVAAPGSGARIQADFNLDGQLDFAATSGNGINVYLASASGTFPSAVQYPTGTGPRSIATGDFDGDSRLDLAVANSGGTVSVLMGNVDGTFASAMNITVGVFPFNGSSGIQPQAIQRGDFNLDGRQDLVVLGFGGSGILLPGNGNGTFGTPVVFTTLGGLDGGLTGGRHMAVGDFNADGKLDILTASESHANTFIPGGGLSVLLGNGDFTFQAAVTYADRSNPTGVTLGDFNRDGRLDIAMANNFNSQAISGQVSVLLGNPNGTFQNPLNYSTVGANPRALAVGDLNADAIPDLAVFNNSGDTAILIGTGTGAFKPSVNFFTACDGLLSGPIGLSIGDFNADGRADLASSSTMLMGLGDGTFSNRQLFTYLAPVVNVDFRTSLPTEVAAGDLNADGNVDLVVAMAGTTVVLFGYGNGSFRAPVRLDPPAALQLDPTSSRLSLSDMDGDGDLDLVTLHARIGQTAGGVAIWRNNGQGLFSAPIMKSIPVPAYEVTGVTGPDLEVGDLNGDGFLDVVVSDSGLKGTDPDASGGVSVLIGIGDGNLELPVRYLMPPRQSAYGVQLGDLNRDGHPELVMLSSPLGFDFSRSAVVVLANTGNGTFAAAKLLDFGGSEALFLATGDLNGDGRADIVIPNSNSNSFNIIFAGDGPVIVTDAPVTVTGLNLNPRASLAFTTTVATFVNANPFEEASDFTAMISWGDGQTSPGTIRDNPLGGFQVTGTHTYASIGTYTTTVSVRETGFGTHRDSATARVSITDQALTATGLAFQAIEDLPFTGVVATFTDSNTLGSKGDFSALINWGDGSTSTGTIAVKDGGGFSVYGNHTYVTPGAYAVLTTINDIDGSSASATSTAQVALDVNRPPVAINDTYTVQEDSTLNVIPSRGILVNDTDSDGDLLSSVVVASTMHGTLTLMSNGSLTYVPGPNFFGIDSFTYRANDGQVLGNLATVAITVNPVNDAGRALNDLATTDEDVVVVINVLANDSDVDGTINPATVNIIAQPTNGLAKVNPDTGQVTYTPTSNFYGYDSFRYRVMDNVGMQSNIATVSIFVNPVNDVPVARNDVYWVSEDTARNIFGAKGLLANDTDVDGDSLTVMLVTTPSHGTLTLERDGSFTYIPAANYFGGDSFTYRTRDGFGLSLPASVSLTIVPVNDAPVVDSLGNTAFFEGTGMSLTGSFSDADPGNSWTATVDYGDGSEVQSLELVGTTFALNHLFADSGIYHTTVEVVDQDGSIGVMTFEVRVQNLAATVNAGPDQSVTEGSLVSVSAAFLDLGTVDTHTAIIDWGDGTLPTTVSVNESMGAGLLTTTHIYADDGEYLVVLTVTDDEGAVGSDRLTISVDNLPPRINAGLDLTTNEGEIVSINANITDPGSVDIQIVTVDWGDGTPILTLPVGRTLNGWSVAPKHRYVDNGIYLVTFTVTDNDGSSASDTVIVTAQNVSPLVDSGPDRTVNSANFVELPTVEFFDFFDEDFSPKRQLRQSGSFVDPGGLDTHVAMIDWGDGTLESVDITERAIGSEGAPTTASGIVRARHRYARPGTYTAALSLTDNDGGIGTDSFVVTVLSSGNNAPNATHDQASTDEDTPIVIDVLANDSIAPDMNETLSVINITQPAHGTAEINANGSVTYAPSLNYFGTDQFNYTIDDGRGGTASALVSLVVHSINDAAIISGSSAGSVTEDHPINQVGGTLTVSDPDVGQSLFQEPADLQGTYGMFSFIASTGIWAYTLDNNRPATDALGAGQVVSDSLSVSSVDGTATRSIIVTINGVDSPTDVTSLITFRYYGAQYNARTKTYAFYGTITNKSNQSIRGPIELGWSQLRPTTAGAKGNTGIWPDGSPYFDLSAFVGSDGILQPGETSQPRTFAVTVASPGAYSFATHVTGVVSLGDASGENAQQSDLGRLAFEETDKPTLESETLFYPKHNVGLPADVNNDGLVSPLDALLVIDTLTSKGSRSVAVDRSEAPYVDTSADNQLSPLDALFVIASLDRNRSAGEGEVSTSDLLKSPSTQALSIPPITPAIDEYFSLLEHESGGRLVDFGADETDRNPSRPRHHRHDQANSLLLIPALAKEIRSKSREHVDISEHDLDTLAADLARKVLDKTLPFNGM